MRKQKDLKEAREEHINEIEKLMMTHSDIIENYKKQLETQMTKNDDLKKKLMNANELNKRLSEEIDTNKHKICA